jgi:hypothetical protein
MYLVLLFQNQEMAKSQIICFCDIKCFGKEPNPNSYNED